MNKDEYYMQLALKEAQKAFEKGEVPVGAIIVLDDKIIGKGHNLREKTNDITKHAELIAINKASKFYNDWRLENSAMYVTLFPCPMCASAIVQSRISKLIVGASSLDLKTCDISKKIMLGNNTNPGIKVKNSIFEKECKKLLIDFFNKKRNLEKSKNF